MLEELREQLLKAQNRMKQQANHHRREVEFQVGEQVFLKIKPNKLKKLVEMMNQKLNPRLYGPYQILEKISPVAYKLKLPEYNRVHQVFHVSLLKKLVDANTIVQPICPLLSQKSWNYKFTQKKAMAMKHNYHGNVEVLIKWKDSPDCENSWLLLAEFQEQISDLHLEDKVNLERGRIDRDPRPTVKPTRTKVYERRPRKGGAPKSHLWGARHLIIIGRENVTNCLVRRVERGLHCGNGYLVRK